MNKDYILQILNIYLPIELCLKIIDYNKCNCCICNNSNPYNFKLEHIFNDYQKCDNCLFLEYHNNIN